MPKDDVHGAGPSSLSQKTPLQRGDACLYCRKRRIRCSGNKPDPCDHCRRLRRECIYDNGKPVSRVRQLEDKVAELETLLRGGAPPPDSSRRSSEVDGPDGSMDFQEETHFDLNVVHTLSDGGPTGFFPGFGGGIFLGSSGPGQGSTLGASQNIVPTLPAQPTGFDFGTLDPCYMTLVNSLSATSTSAAPAPHPAPAPHVHLPPPPPPPPPPPEAVHPVSAVPPGMESVFAMEGITPGTRALFDTILNSSTGSAPAPPVQANGADSFINTDRSMGPTPPSGSTDPLARPSTYPFSSDSSPGLLPPRTSSDQSSPASISAIPDQFERSSRVQNVLGVVGDEPDPPPRPLPVAGDGTGFGWKSDIDLGGTGLEMVGGWFDAADLPRVARDHLLDLFFSGMRVFGQEFHIPRFFAQLTLPVAKRPHPCMLYTMYLLASRISTSPSIRALEPHFCKIANEKLEESIRHADRLFDAVRASTMLAVYKFSQARYHEGWMMTGQAARLAISCGLHQIPSSLHKPSPIPEDQRGDLVNIMRHRSYVLPAPSDPIELGERIWAFWSLFIVDRAASISSQYPVAFADEVITTPYPKPLYEYELGLVTPADDWSISSTYDATEARRLPHYADGTSYIIRIRALDVLEKSSKLMYLKPEPGLEARTRDASTSVSPPGGIDEYLDWQNYEAVFQNFSPPTNGSSPSGNGGSAKKGHGWARTARIRTPKAYEEIYQALLRIEADLPPERRTNWAVWDGKVQDWHYVQPVRKDVINLHFVIGCAWMFLFDVFSFGAENTQAVAVAQRLCHTIRVVPDVSLTGDFDVFIAMTWSFIVKILIRESKRLVAQDNLLAARPIDADIDLVVNALRNFGRNYNLASAQAGRADRYRNATAEELDFMEGDEIDDGHSQLHSHQKSHQPWRGAATA